MGQTEYCISVTKLFKNYNRIHAIDGISFNVEYGKVFGFLGPNGAGKTTTIKVLTTLIQPSFGIVKIFGKDIQKHSLEIRKRIGIVLQQPSFESRLTVERSLDLYGLLWRIPAEKRKHKVRELLKTFDLESIRSTKNDDLSIGQRRRVQVAREFIHDMELLFLDEPTVGLDPAARRILLDYIKKQVSAGLTVFFTTHIMEEAEYLCDQIAILDKGKIIAFDTPRGLKQKYGGIKTIEIRLKDTIDQSVLHIVKSIAGSSDVETPDTNTIRLGSIDAQSIMVKTMESFSRKGIQIENIAINPPSLEEVFLNIINHDKNEEANGRLGL